MSEQTCEICGNGFVCEQTYGDSECPHCGQKYTYEEGPQLVLTQRQKLMLFNLNMETISQ